LRQRTCAAIKHDGKRCRQNPLQGEEFCFWHHPEYAEEADQARRLGGERRRREKITEGAYDLEGMASVPSLRRLLEVAMLDALGLENSVARSRVIVSGVLAGVKLVEVGELEDRLAAVEAALGPRVVAGKRRRA
jgi:hypothetical protein